jgi:thiamine biosynthesis protein ThiS
MVTLGEVEWLLHAFDHFDSDVVVGKEIKLGCTQCATIVVMLNGESFALHQGMVLSDFLQGRGYAPDQRMACAINTKVISKADYATIMLNNGDRIDVVAPVLPGVLSTL